MPFRKAAVWLALVLVLVFGIVLRASHVHDRRQLTPNERTYLYYAGRIHDEGIGAWKALYAEFIHDPELWAVAPPVRVGYVILLDGAMAIMHTKTEAAGMALSFLSSVLTLLIVAWLGLRFFNPWVSLIASALCTTSAIEIWLVRGTPQDGLFGLSGLLAVWLTCEIMRSPRRTWLYPLFHVVGIWSCLSKQQGCLVYLLSALWLFCFLLIYERARRQAILLLVGVAAGLVIVCGIFVFLAGDPHSAWKAWEISFISNDESWAYQDECCFGPWTQIPIALFLLSPLTFALSIAGLAILALPRVWVAILTPLQRKCGGVCAIMAVSFTAMFSITPKMQILRFLTPGDGSICLVAGVGFWYMMTFARRRLARVEYCVLLVLVAGGFLGSMARDHAVFNKLAKRAGVSDTSSETELGAEQIRFVLGM